MSNSEKQKNQWELYYDWMQQGCNPRYARDHVKAVSDFYGKSEEEAEEFIWRQVGDAESGRIKAATDEAQDGAYKKALSDHGIDQSPFGDDWYFGEIDINTNLRQWVSENIFEACKSQIEELLFHIDMDGGDIMIFASGYEYCGPNGRKAALEKKRSLEDVLMEWAEWEDVGEGGVSAWQDLSERVVKALLARSAEN